MSNVDKSIDKFKSKIEQGSVYDAQQFLKTVYHRLRSRKAYDGSRQLLQLAACIQYKHDEVKGLNTVTKRHNCIEAVCTT